MTFCIVGANGLIGRHLVARLVADGAQVVPISRSPARVAGLETTVWDPARGPFPDAVREASDVVVNLAGTPIGPGRWTAARRRSILESRVGTTRAIADALALGGPSVLCNASAVGVYGSGEEPVDEASPVGTGFLADVCTRWEAEARRAGDHARVVLLRTAVVLARDGGALPPLVRLARIGLAGRIGSGRQWFPWIHVDDDVAAILRCAADPSLEGPVNLAAPDSVRQADFAAALRRRVGPGIAPALPSLLVRAGLGEASALLCEGQRVVPAKLVARGAAPRFDTLDAALLDLLA